MSFVFLKLVNMSIAAGWLSMAVIVFRLFFRKVPKWVFCVLWGLVGIRLICPVTVESIFSLLPSGETIPQEIVYAKEPTIHSGVTYLNSYVNPIISDKLAPAAEGAVSPMQTIVLVAAVIWLTGVLVMTGYGVISYVRLYHRIREAVPCYNCIERDMIWLCDHISTPFILGVFNPRIYLPSDMNEADMEFVIAHERAHLKRRDHWWKPAGFALLTVYWFNPVMWVAYILLCRDIELACDERVIRDFGAESKKSYLETLINCSASKRVISACPLAFGEVGVERRIKNVLYYKKPALWILAGAVAACIVAAVCFLTNPVEEQKYATVTMIDGVPGMRMESIEYVYRNSPEPLMPRLSLNMEDNSAAFSFAMFSSEFWPVGAFEMTDTELLVTAGDLSDKVRKKYVFQKEGENYIFDAERSSTMPTYNYGVNKGYAKPVSDGAVFEPVVIHLTVDKEEAYSNIIDGMLADIDNDGRTEICTISYGPTSGLFTFKFSIKDFESGELEYFNIFNTTFYELTFDSDRSGHFYLSGKTENGIEKAHMLRISLEEGNIVLTPDEDSKGVIEYWGEQGVHSEWVR